MPGVERVASEIKSPDALADAEIWREPRRQRPVRSPEFGKLPAIYDHLGTKMRLLTDSRTPALDINVETQAGS